MHKLEIKLKQHTPLIHFQHDQEGATLRASEVKPKLDKFIITKLKGSEIYDQGVKEGWIKNKNGKEWLDYKMRFSSLEKENSMLLKTYPKNDNKYETAAFPLILANMGGKSKEEELVNLILSKTSQVDMETYTTNENLHKIIKDNIGLFFALNNFGQRQDKGFGSFTVESVDGVKKDFPKDFLPNGTVYLKYSYPLKAKISKKKRQEQLFKVIEFYWKTLKSGINYTQYDYKTSTYRFPERYIKAYLWKYLNEDIKNKQTWEKRKIKEFFNLTAGSGRERPENTHPASFARALFGLPDKFEYKNKGKTVEIKHSANTRSDDFIARIPSPIVFKPVITVEDSKIYILINNSSIEQLKKLTNLTFTFVCGPEMSLNVDPNIIEIQELIVSYSKYLHDIVRLKAFETIDETKNYAKLNNIGANTNWFIPLDFNWQNIISGEVYDYRINKPKPFTRWVEVHKL